MLLFSFRLTTNYLQRKISFLTEVNIDANSIEKRVNFLVLYLNSKYVRKNATKLFFLLLKKGQKVFIQKGIQEKKSNCVMK